ncbi:unnamed protein product [Heligmosomoides polygyrus]|uniref:Transposase n=1 Tax=Heligmosomoides polygyrus TaxID=6339 RepID=A0A183F2S5_HELPZ|nr:unnamed protein product [Heligmosomoides polygyrus]
MGDKIKGDNGWRPLSRSETVQLRVGLQTEGDVDRGDPLRGFWVNTGRVSAFASRLDSRTSLPHFAHNASSSRNGPVVTLAVTAARHVLILFRSPLRI